MRWAKAHQDAPTHAWRGDVQAVCGVCAEVDGLLPGDADLCLRCLSRLGLASVPDVHVDVALRF